MKKILTIILVVAIAGVFAYGGLSYIKNRESAQTGKQSEANSPSQINNGTDDPSEDGKYLVIKEWNVRYLVPDALQGDLTYGIAKVKDPEPGWDSTIVYIASKKLTSLSENCGLTSRDDEYMKGSFGGHYAISRTKNSKDENGNALSITDGTYWYFTEKTNASCASSQDDEISEYEQTFVKEVGGSQMLNKVEVISQ